MTMRRFLSAQQPSSSTLPLGCAVLRPAETESASSLSRSDRPALSLYDVYLPVSGLHASQHFASAALRLRISSARLHA